MTPAWTVGAWPPVLWQPHCEATPYFVHLGTHVSPRLSTDWPRMGQTVWGGRAADSAAGVSWDWIEITEDVVAISDPMMMITNLRVLGRDGGVMCAHEAAPYLNQLVNGLPWQAEVLKALAEVACEPPSRAPLPVPPRRPGAERRARARPETASVG
jgi:hypothetical protein